MTRPRPLWSLTRHYWLAQRMARATGVYLAAAMETAELTQTDWASMVQRCRGCTWRSGCEHWLDDPSDQRREVPDTCANQHRFQKLLEQAGS